MPPAAIKMAIKSLARGNTPGVGGFPVTFYSAYADTLAPQLLGTFEEAREGGSLLSTTKEALIVMLHKPNIDPTEMG